MTYFSLYPTSIITTGAKRACIIDVEKAAYSLIPNSLAYIFQKEKTFQINEMISRFDREDREVFMSYLSFLEKNNFGLKTLFKLNFTYEYNIDIPYNILSIIVDALGLEDALHKCSILPKSYSTQLRLFFSPGLEAIDELAKKLTLLERRNVELIFNFNLNYSISEYVNLYLSYSHCISRLVVMNCEYNWIEENGRVCGTKQELLSSKQCGIVSEYFFTPNIYNVILSEKCNTCLYKKIAIDIEGNIKNCPSMLYNYGHIENTNLNLIFESKNFQKKWHITKDKIDVCMDCEFRNICSDCRAYIENPSDDKSKPLKCGYNPFTMQWKKWQNDPLKISATNYYKINNLGI